MKGRLPHVDGDPALNSFRGSRPFDVRNVGFHKSSATFFHLAYERSTVGLEREPHSLHWLLNLTRED